MKKFDDFVDNEERLISILDSASDAEIYDILEEAIQNQWPYAFMAAINKANSFNVDPSEIVRRVLSEASYGRFCIHRARRAQ